MNIIHSEYSFPSATGITDIYCQSYAPENTDEIKGIIVIVHGMAEHTDRYAEAADYLAQRGYAVYMNDHAGHGKSIAKDGTAGYFGHKGGNEAMVDDIKSTCALAKKNVPGKKLVIWGHSMGSFITRRFIVKHKGIADAAVICGTAGPNPAAGIGAVMANIIGTVGGEKKTSKFLNGLAFGSYNKKFTGDTGFEWLSVNKENIDKYVADPMCGYLFSAYGYRDLFRLLGSVSSKDWFGSVPNDIPLTFISGSDDPVGNYGKGVQQVYDKLIALGHKNVTMKLYEGLRHEIHNEDSRFDVYKYIADFCDNAIK